MSSANEGRSAASSVPRCVKAARSMPPERRDSTDPREWLRRARSNVARTNAHQGEPGILYEDLCRAAFGSGPAVRAPMKRGLKLPATLGERLRLGDGAPGRCGLG